jgi:predicted AlkP superfamily phosphohydrolase/phosphomutase
MPCKPAESSETGKRRPVIAIGLDAADPDLLDAWIAEGKLPNLARLRQEGGYGRLTNLDHYKAETPWTTFLTGCLPQTTGYWTPARFAEGSYRVEEVAAYDFHEHPPFYALGHDYRVAIFDVPQSTLSPDVNGPQVLAWGAHSPQTPSHSAPPELLGQIIAQFGPHPALHRDHGDWWNEAYLRGLHANLITGIRRRTDICCDWLRQERWDLFLTVFGETHSAGHDFWHLSQSDHPLHGQTPSCFTSDPLLDVFAHVDGAIGEILAAAPHDAQVLVFSVHGSGRNANDVPSMLFLPEFLYRFSFPGSVMLAPGKAGASVPAQETRLRRRQWQNEIWSRQYRPNALLRILRKRLPRRLHRILDRAFGASDPLPSLARLNDEGVALYWQPAMWFSHLWPKMRAFALPSFSEGYVRINVRGREPQGVVDPADYDAVCDELSNELLALRNPRTGNATVKRILRTRQAGCNFDPKLPAADLVVVWSDEASDVVDHPRLGRVGPVPYRRTGSHRERGFWLLKAAGIARDSTLPTGHAVDLAATILDLMGARPAHRGDGQSLLQSNAPAPEPSVEVSGAESLQSAREDVR